jgi:hypothetical protein
MQSWFPNHVCTVYIIWANVADDPQQWHQWVAACLESQLANFSFRLILALFLDHIKQ